MNIFIKMAWRNIRRNLRRTLITLGALSFGLASIVVFFGFTDGFHTQWVENTVKAYSGHIVIHKAGFRDDPKIGNSIDDPAVALKTVEATGGVASYATRIELAGLASTAENSAGVFIRGIDMEREKGVSAFHRRILEGEYLKEGDRWTILLGKRLAKKLKAGLGDKIVLMIQAADGSIGAELFRLRGVFSMGSIDLDSSLAVISKADAAELAVLGPSVTTVSVIVETPYDVVPAAASLKAALEPLGYEVLPWQESMPALSEMIDLDNAFMYVLLSIVLVIVSLGILNTMLMSIMERTREFGIMMAVGTRPWHIVLLVMTESFLLGLMGVCLGVVIGIGINSAIAVNGFDLSRWAGAMELFAALDPVIYPETQMVNIVGSSVAIFATALLVSIYPAVKASKLKPVEAIRYI